MHNVKIIFAVIFSFQNFAIPLAILVTITIHYAPEDNFREIFFWVRRIELMEFVNIKGNFRPRRRLVTTFEYLLKVPKNKVRK